MMVELWAKIQIYSYIIGAIITIIGFIILGILWWRDRK